MPGSRRVRSSTCWPGRRHTSRTTSWSRPRSPSPSGRRARRGRRSARLREASLDHLRRRIALPLEAPRDWTRANPLKCTCADCRALGAFLVDAGSTAMAPEGGPGSADPCRAKRPERPVRPRPHDRKARQPPHAGRHQEPGQLRAARKAAPAGSGACVGAGRMTGCLALAAGISGRDTPAATG